MRPPCEIMVTQLLPALRALIGHYLLQDYGFTQSQIAEVLGVTQASVSRSLTQIKRFTDYYTPNVEKTAREFANRLAQGTLTFDESITFLCSFCQSQKTGGIICHLHREKHPRLRACQICVEGMEINPRIVVLSSLARGAQLLEKSEEFTLLIPQVRAQLVMSLPNAENVEDIAGFPGRIGTLNGYAHTFTQPEFGASTHLARILLLIQQSTPTRQAAIVFKHLPTMENQLNQMKLEFYKVSRKTHQDRLDTDEALLEGVKQALTQGVAPDVLIDVGGVGIEPVVYLFAKDAETAVKKAIALAQQFHGRSLKPER